MAEASAPRRRSAVEARQIELGATFAERDGWRQCERFTSPAAECEAVRGGAGLFDLTPLTKLDFRSARPERDWPILFPGETAPAGDRLHRLTLAGRPVLAARLNPRRFFLTAPPGCGPALEAVVRAACAGPEIGVTDVSSGHTILELAGPQAASILRKLSAVPPPVEDLQVVQAHVGEAHVILFRVDGAGGTGGSLLPAFRLHLSRALGLYFWEVLEDAGREFGLVPYGAEARSRLFPNLFPG